MTKGKTSRRPGIILEPSQRAWGNPSLKSPSRNLPRPATSPIKPTSFTQLRKTFPLQWKTDFIRLITSKTSSFCRCNGTNICSSLVTDAMLQLYNNVAGILDNRHPESASRLGFLIYSNMFLPPVRPTTLAPSLFGMIAPIDIDAIHGMDDPGSPERQEFRSIFEKWAKLTAGQLTVYDYDQSMLVWRDLPNPSIQEFEQDVKHYRDAGILGIDTESRLALSTTFINLYLRGRLMWDPDADVKALTDDFYQKFFSPAAKPMAEYWNSIFAAFGATRRHRA